MKAEQILNSDDFQQCQTFHGHVCPGLSMGYVAGKLALAWLQENKSEDEEVVAIVENDSCFVDAVQVLTGCTFGKGNFIYKDYGKMALTLISRNSGRGVRVCLRPGAFVPDEEHFGLLRKVMSGEASEEERARFHQVHQRRSMDLLETPAADLFEVTPMEGSLPEKARIEPSQICSRCGETVMATKMVVAGDGNICRACAGW
ncbi:MAG TPA: formylmethanofuran dehydrogenase [Syntrophobacteraceae bacterium]|jgi:formylmethanofuran dehydrogenase subunit E|nr:formylmethanofuran dehydrogenase [Syntrophobacteraceae bacterium]